MAAPFAGKVAIVTGSSSGLGEATALLFASRGANVTLTGRDEKRLKAVLDKAVKASGGHNDRFLTVQGDLTDQKVRKQIVDQTVAKFGRLDILVANAGTAGTHIPFLQEHEDNFNTIMDTNLKSVFFLIQQAVPHLEKTQGNIVTISSIAAILASPIGIIYSVSKAALDHLTRCLSVDLGQKGIRVNSVNPGYFPTMIMRDYPDVEKLQGAIADSQEVQQPLKGRAGIVQDVAEAVTFLASDAAGFITGEQVKVDGGRVLTGVFSF